MRKDSAVVGHGIGSTPEQRAIIETLAGHVLVVAGVGSGKTHVLARRAAHALDRGTPPESMLALTFTNRAARAMRRMSAIPRSPIMSLS